MKTLLEEVLKFDNKENFALSLEKKKNLACQVIEVVGHYISSKTSIQTHEVVYGLRIALELSELDENTKLQAGLLAGLYNQNRSRGDHIPHLLIDLNDYQKKCYIPVKDWR